MTFMTLDELARVSAFPCHDAMKLETQRNERRRILLQSGLRTEGYR